MKVHFIHPNLTIGFHEQADNFYNVCSNELEEHIEVVNIKKPIVFLSADVSPEDSVIFFNCKNQEYSKDFLSYLDTVVSSNAEIFPIAINEEHRIPPTACNNSQSFDVVEALRQRRLTNANLTTVAYSLSRIVVSRMQPTISKEDMQIFISHRRLDGEELASVFYNEFRARAENAFRDLIDIKVGADAQKIIEENLKKSDVVVFLDTPKSGESKWISRELSIALSLNIPIVWVKIGEEDNRQKLNLIPAENPHFTITDYPISDGSKNAELFDDIIHKAFRISRESARHVFDQLHVLSELTKNNNVSFKKLDTKNLIYKIEIPRTGFRYYQKPLIQILQCYGRHPNVAETQATTKHLEKLGYITHPEHGSYYDTAIMLSPIKHSEEVCHLNFVTESFDDYINYLEHYLHPQKKTIMDKNGIVISGAFPDCEPEFQQYLTDAVYSLTKSVFQRNGTVIFGAHPTFQHLIFDMGKMHRKDDFQEAIHLYLSKYFVTDNAIDELTKNATVKATDVVENDRSKSLTLMRESMLSDDRAIALVCLGGKTRAGGHQPGVDEEIAIARDKGLPVFLIGSVGGRSAELASQYFEGECTEKLNNLSLEDNFELMTSLDYRNISYKILNSLGL